MYSDVQMILSAQLIGYIGSPAAVGVNVSSPALRLVNFEDRRRYIDAGDLQRQCHTSLKVVEWDCTMAA